MQFKNIIFLSLLISSLHSTVIGMECFTCDVEEDQSSEEKPVKKETHHKRTKKKRRSIKIESMEDQSEEEEERQDALIRSQIPEQVSLICTIAERANPNQQDILHLETWLNKHGKETNMFVWRSAIDELSKQVNNELCRCLCPENLRKVAVNKVVRSFAYTLRPDKDYSQKSLSDQIKEEFQNIKYSKDFPDKY
jgi:hypothetical protein